MLLLIAMPSPVPCTLFVTESSARVNTSNRCFWNSSVMPMPLSLTTKAYFTYECPLRDTSRTSRLISPPCWVYLTAFDRMFSSTCRKRVASPMKFSW